MEKQSAAEALAHVTHSMSAEEQELWSRMVIKAMRAGVSIDIDPEDVVAARGLVASGLAEAGGILTGDGGHIVMTSRFADLMEAASA